MPASNSSPLPLGWTRVTRRRVTAVLSRSAAVDNNENNRDAEEEDCCDGVNCRRGYGSTVALPQKIGSTSRLKNTIVGQAMFCLPDADCDWFQGYFVQDDRILYRPPPQHAPTSIVENSSEDEPQMDHTSFIRPQRLHYGLLATGLDIDDCLQCQHGGYREVSLSITPLGPKAAAVRSRKRKRVVFPMLQWTGGDMMQLSTPALETTSTASQPAATDASDGRPDPSRKRAHSSSSTSATTTTPQCHFRASKLYSGAEARKKVSTVFASLLRRLRRDETTNVTTTTRSVADLMPDVVVVSGRMELTWPVKGEDENDFYA